MILIVLGYSLINGCAKSGYNLTKRPVDYSYTQDSRDSLIARIHHYEVTVKPDRNMKAERNATIALFILISLIVMLTL